MNSNAEARSKNGISSEQFTQIVDAILRGKYSWACVLFLKFSGYNPLHYIPYRTYNRLMKENTVLRHRGVVPHPASQRSDRNFTDRDELIDNLEYLEPVNLSGNETRGGDRSWDYVELEFMQSWNRY